MSGLTDLALRMRTLLFILAGLMVAGGVLDVLWLPVEAVPDISPREVLVTIVAPGLAPEEVERLVTFPVESQMTGLPQMTDLRSISRFGVSVVYVEFADETDISLDRTLVNERLQAARASITAVAVVPTMGPMSTGLGEIMQFQLAGPGHSLMELNTLMTWHVAPMLKQVAGRGRPQHQRRRGRDLRGPARRRRDGPLRRLARRGVPRGRRRQRRRRRRLDRAQPGAAGRRRPGAGDQPRGPGADRAAHRRRRGARLCQQRGHGRSSRRGCGWARRPATARARSSTRSC